MKLQTYNISVLDRSMLTQNDIYHKEFMDQVIIGFQPWKILAGLLAGLSEGFLNVYHDLLHLFHS